MSKPRLPNFYLVESDGTRVELELLIHAAVSSGGSPEGPSVDYVLVRRQPQTLESVTRLLEMWQERAEQRRRHPYPVEAYKGVMISMFRSRKLGELDQQLEVRYTSVLERLWHVMTSAEQAEVEAFVRSINDL